MSEHKRLVKKLLSDVGIHIDGNNPWDIQVHNEGFYKRILTEGELGLGESYMDKWWDADQLEETLARMLREDMEDKVKKNLKLLVWVISHKVFDYSSKKRAFTVGQVHYDVGNDLYKLMLDKRMTYTCGYWAHASTLDASQVAKLDLVCKKLELKKGEKVLDIGCGWGSFAKFAAEKYGVTVVGITISQEQAELARKNCQGLPVTIRLQDYRDITEKFDKIVSLGMFEHVGHKNYKKYMQIVHNSLAENGLFLLDCAASNVPFYDAGQWTDKYIFPNGNLPSITQLGRSVEGLFVIEDLHNMGIDYYKTLMAWYKNFDTNWPKIAEKYGERFYRMWRFYLLGGAAFSKSRTAQNWQVVLSKGRLSGYTSLR